MNLTQSEITISNFKSGTGRMLSNSRYPR